MSEDLPKYINSTGTQGRIERLQANQTPGSILPLASALPADEIAFWKWQEHAVDSRIFFGTVQELRLEAGGSYERLGILCNTIPTLRDWIRSPSRYYPFCRSFRS